jgi:ubiquinone/menaquinone biosynthesis C-methylase UbiE
MLIWILALSILLLMLVAHMDKMDKEFFDNPEEEGVKTRTYEDPNDIYDTLYASIYDRLFTPPERISFEKMNIEAYGLEGFPATETKLLDVCCGTAPHAEWLCKTDIDLVGIDGSEAMLQKARQRCTRARFYKGDITRAETFPPKSFSHAMMLYFSIYQFRNPKQVLDNLYSWLKPGGVLILHLVNPDKFDPILDAASPFAMFSLQKYSKERITDSEVVFDKFTYKSRFLKDAHDENAVFEEVIRYNNPEKNEGYTYRENKHRLYMPSLDAMLDIVRSSGFSRHEMVDMMPAGYEYQYLVFFTK